MTLFWGIMGILHAVFLPGAAICALIAPRRLGHARFASLAFVLSLVVNYVMAMVLVQAGLYTRPALMLAAAASALILLAASLARGPSKERPQAKSCFPPNKAKYISYSFNLIFFAALLLVALFFHKTVFKSIDQILSWNYWAGSWAANSYPQIRGDYPQLMPIIKSIPYIFIGTTDILVFSIVSLDIFIVFFLICLSTLKGGRYGPAVPVVALLSVYFWVITQAGYADAMVGLLALMAFVILQWSLEPGLGRGEKRLHLFLAFQAAAAAAVIKQTGMLWWPWFVLVAAELLEGRTVRERARTLFLPVLASALVAFPWYLYNRYLIAQGDVAPNILLIINSPEIYQGRGLAARIWRALGHYPQYFLFLVPAVWGLKAKGLRFLSASSIFMVLCFLFLFSYASRNLRFPVMLSFFPLGCLIDSWHEKGSLGRQYARLCAFLSKARQVLLRRTILCASIVLAAILAISYANGTSIDQKLLRERVRSSLEIGLSGVTKRIDWLQSQSPQRMLSIDGRLKQLLSVQDEGFVSYGEHGGFALGDFGYIVISDAFLPSLQDLGLDELFAKDFQERDISIYVRRDLIGTIYGLDP
jgi:hypothetical protein